MPATADPQPPSRDDQYVFGSVLLLANRLQRAFDARLPGELTLKQWLALILLRNLGGGAGSVAQIAQSTGNSHQNATKMFALLAREGWVERRASTTDQRAWEVSLTARAHEYFRDHEALGERLLAALYDGIPAQDVAATARTLAAMQTNLERI